MAAPDWFSMADPVHGLIRFDRNKPTHQLVLDIINTAAFQRLRRIKQMGLAEFVFPGATHNRFIHSIGSAWLMVNTIEHLQRFPKVAKLLSAPFEDTGIPLEKVLMLSILLHDIGHTPLSHTLEDTLRLKEEDMLHDSYWNTLILQNDPELQELWQNTYPNLPEAIDRFNGATEGYEKHFLADLVSSQLDMDRLDYLQRDSHFLGVQYGCIEAERIITNLLVDTKPDGNPAIALREEAVPALEHYLYGRHQAYKMALHSLDKASETLLRKTFERFAWVRDQGQNPGAPADLLYTLMRHPRDITVDDYLMLDDAYLWHHINLWARRSEDPLLKELAYRMLHHDLFKFVDVLQYTPHFSEADKEAMMAALTTHYNDRGLSIEFGMGTMAISPKPLYQPYPIKPPIWIRKSNGDLIDFAEVSSLPLRVTTDHGKRFLVFVWDKEARQFLKDFLRQRFSATAV